VTWEKVPFHISYGLAPDQRTPAADIEGLVVFGGEDTVWLFDVIADVDDEFLRVFDNEGGNEAADVIGLEAWEASRILTDSRINGSADADVACDQRFELRVGERSDDGTGWRGDGGK
jgi:hypothetical protein